KDVYINASLYILPEGLEKASIVEPWCYFENVKILNSSGFVELECNGNIDETEDLGVYNINGVKIGCSIKGLPSGLYIVRYGNRAQKILINAF
ncbi:MAG: hypothetical protein K2G92_08675, partial [Duncaniella sp.]|nr:hypothetical protein [Duncaniella sp.]